MPLPALADLPKDRLIIGTAKMCACMMDGVRKTAHRGKGIHGRGHQLKTSM